MVNAGRLNITEDISTDNDEMIVLQEYKDNRYFLWVEREKTPERNRKSQSSAAYIQKKRIWQRSYGSTP